MKKGISLVALVITIIVLIILTAAVVFTSGNAPESANLAVFFNDLGSIQDAVTIKMLANTADAAANNNYNPTAAEKLAGIASATVKGHIGTTNYYAFDANAATTLGLSGATLSEYAVAEDGTVVYYGKEAQGTAGTGFNYNGSRYFTRTATATTETFLAGSAQ